MGNRTWNELFSGTFPDYTGGLPDGKWRYSKSDYNMDSLYLWRNDWRHDILIWGSNNRRIMLSLNLDFYDYNLKKAG